jgi:hypothetical protein
MTLSYVTDPSPTAPLACDCIGAVVFIVLKAGYRELTRDGHGVVRAQLMSRIQSSNGTWTYSFVVDESGLVTPLPTLTGDMVQVICCEGCNGFAAEAFSQDEFGGMIVAKEDALVLAVIEIRHMIRPFLLQDLRAWATVAPTAAVEINLLVDGETVSVAPLRIPAGQTVSDRTFTFTGGGTTYLIAEGALVALEVISIGAGSGYTPGPGASGLEVWFFGHLNPSPYS